MVDGMFLWLVNQHWSDLYLFCVGHPCCFCKQKRLKMLQKRFRKKKCGEKGGDFLWLMDETYTSQAFTWFRHVSMWNVERGELQTPWMFFHRFIQEKGTLKPHQLRFMRILKHSKNTVKPSRRIFGLILLILHLGTLMFILYELNILIPYLHWFITIGETPIHPMSSNQVADLRIVTVH